MTVYGLKPAFLIPYRRVGRSFIAPVWVGTAELARANQTAFGLRYRSIFALMQGHRVLAPKRGYELAKRAVRLNGHPRRLLLGRRRVHLEAHFGRPELGLELYQWCPLITQIQRRFVSGSFPSTNCVRQTTVFRIVRECHLAKRHSPVLVYGNCVRISIVRITLH